MKRYLGMVYLLYSIIISYIVFTNKLKNFLAPSMQLYIKLSIIPLLVIGLIILFHNNYKFKISDLILLLPIVLLIISGDGRLTSSFAINRTTNFNNNKKTIEKEEINNIPKEMEIINDFKPYFDITDEEYIELSDYITNAPKANKYLGKTVRIRDFALKNIDFMDSNYFAIGKYAITCCAADASFAGLIIKYDNNKIMSDNWYEIEGVLENGKDTDGYSIMYVKIINIKEIDEEDQYVYPCYAYDTNSCNVVSKYNLEY